MSLKAPTPMSPSELHDMIEGARRRNFSLADLARALEIDYRKLSKYKSGEMIIPRPVELAIRCVLCHSEDGDAVLNPQQTRDYALALALMERPCERAAHIAARCIALHQHGNPPK